MGGETYTYPGPPADMEETVDADLGARDSLPREESVCARDVPVGFLPPLQEGTGSLGFLLAFINRGKRGA